MDHQRIFIANLSKGRLGQDKANVMGSLLATQFQLAAMTRVNQPEEDRADYPLIIDEFQNFTTDSFASMLAEARKYHLCLTLSHQYTGQIDNSLREAVFGNVGTLVSFRVGNDDAEILEKQFGGTFLARQFVELDRFEVHVKMLRAGALQEPFRATTLAPLGDFRGHRSKFVAHCRQRYATPRNVVESKLSRWSHN